jgi:hypothetical protein
MARRSARIIALCLGTALVPALPLLALAQTAPAPEHEGGTYDYKKHQPTEVAPSTTSTKQVDDEVKELLKQTDRLDKQFGQSQGSK